MADDPSMKSGKTADLFAPKRNAEGGGQPPRKSAEDTFADDFADLKGSVIRPTFEIVGNRMTERGHKFNISEEPGGKISIHIVPAGANQSIHPYDWFPTFSLFGAPYTKSIGVHCRNMRPNSEASPRGEYKVAQLSKDVVEKELMKFIGEIANW
jgi:hypothetical protein